MFWLRPVLLLSLFFTAGFLSAQHNTPPFIKRCPVKTINYETGLLNNGTSNIITDRLGFTWVSSFTGLQRYNGYTLQTITPIAGKDTFRINYPAYFFELKNGVIWISFKSTLLQYDPGLDKFTVLVHDPHSGNAPFSIVPLKETSQGIWCMQEKKGIVLYNDKGKLLKQTVFFETALVDEIINSHELLYLNKICSNDRFIFINKANSKNGYTSINRNEGVVLFINTEKEQAGEISVGYEDILGITCNNDNLFVLTPDAISIVAVDNPAMIRRKQFESRINNNMTMGGLRIKEHLLLLSIDNHLFEFDTAGNYKAEFTDLNRNPVVAAGFIHQIYPDKLNRVWLITNNDIKRIENLEIPFVHFIYPGEKNNFVKTIYFDKQKNIIIAGCFYTGVQLYDTLANPLWEKPVNTSQVSNIIAIEKLTGDSYLLTTYERGWHLLNICLPCL